MALVGHLGDMFEILGAVFGMSEAMLDESGLGSRKWSSYRDQLIFAWEKLGRGGGKWWQIVANGGKCWQMVEGRGGYFVALLGDVETCACENRWHHGKVPLVSYFYEVLGRSERPSWRFESPNSGSWRPFWWLLWAISGTCLRSWGLY